LLSVCRYVDRNALTAGLVRGAEDWRRGSLWARANGDAALRALLSAWPVERPADWTELVNRPLTLKETEGASQHSFIRIVCCRHF